MSDILSISYGAPSGAVESIKLDEHFAKPSTKLWMRMITGGKWDRRKLKRIMRLVGEGR